MWQRAGYGTSAHNASNNRQRRGQGSLAIRFLKTGMSNARVLMQKIHSARDVENSEIPEIASLRKLMRDIASQLRFFQFHVEDRDIWAVKAHKSNCFCNTSCYFTNIMALI